MTPARENILGVAVSAVNMTSAVREIDRLIRQGARSYICVVAAHSLMDCQRDPGLRRIFNRAAMATPDGMPLVWYLRLRGYPQVGRVYGPDLMLAVCERSLQLGHRHFFYGGTGEVLEDLRQKLQGRYQGLQIAGAYAPPFGALDRSRQEPVLDRINASGASIVWVGIGSPRQERWMAEMLGRIWAPVMIGVGAAFDFLSGHKPQAPRWMQRTGLEWAFRLASEPRRLTGRYARYPLFLALILAQLSGLKRFNIED